jgi:hypothetical protein
VAANSLYKFHGQYIICCLCVCASVTNVMLTNDVWLHRLGEKTMAWCHQVDSYDPNFDLSTGTLWLTPVQIQHIKAAQAQQGRVERNTWWQENGAQKRAKFSCWRLEDGGWRNTDHASLHLNEWSEQARCVQVPQQVKLHALVYTRGSIVYNELMYLT